MNQTGMILLLLLLFSIKTVNSIEDLLDQYVKHVDQVNSVPPNYNPGNSNQRFRRRTSDFVNFNSPSDLNLKSSAEKSNKISESSVRFKRDSGDFEPWTHSQILDNDGYIVLRWQPRHQEISFRIEARTTGYVGIGFSPNGGMKEADILIGWIDDYTSKAHLLVSKKFTIPKFNLLISIKYSLVIDRM